MEKKQVGFTTIKDEIKKCAKSFKYFCENYVKILHPEQGLVLFKLYSYQERVIESLIKHRFNIVSKFRQAGLTTLAAAFSLWKCMFHFDFRVLVISKTDREAVDVGKKVQIMIDNLPDWLKPKMRNNSAHEKDFEETNGIMWFYTPEAARSKSASLLIVDEAAFIKKMHEHWKSMYPVLATGGSCAVISTVNGMGNWYEETYHEAKAKKNVFNIIEIDYKEHPEYNTPEWEKTMRANMGEKAWNQEILRQFGSSGDTYLPGELIQLIQSQIEEPRRKLFPEWDSSSYEKSNQLSNVEYVKGALWEWSPPEPGKEYLISVDTGAGLGETCDSSTFQVIDIEKYEQVAEFQSNIIPIFDFAKIVNEIGIFYNDALLVIENNSIGTGVIQLLINKLNYENIFYEKNGASKEKAGLKITRDNRQNILETMKTFFAKGIFQSKSYRLYNEFLTFVVNRNTNKPQATSKRHDDLIMSLANGLYILDQNNSISTSVINFQNDVMSNLATQGLDEIKKSLEEGLETDLQLEDLGIDELVINNINYKNKLFTREHDQLLKSFGF